MPQTDPVLAMATLLVAIVCHAWMRALPAARPASAAFPHLAGCHARGDGLAGTVNGRCPAGGLEIAMDHA